MVSVILTLTKSTSTEMGEAFTAAMGVVMNVSETCSCGASFTAEGDGVVRLLKEWRKTHPCAEKPSEPADGVFTVSNAQVEQAPMGFTIMHPGREDHALDE